MNDKVKKLRKTLGLTLEKFGERLGVGKNAISRIETGKSNLTDQMLKAICNVNWNGRYANEEWFRGTSKEMFKTDPGNELKALSEKYQMSNTEYVFLKEFFKLEPSRREDFFETLDKVFSAIHGEYIQTSTLKELPTDISKITNEELGRRMRPYLEIEEKAEAKSEA